MEREAGQQWLLDEVIRPYLADPNPGHALVLAASPGFGKTHLMAKVADALARQGRYTFWSGPRHDLYRDILKEVRKFGGDPALWQEWYPHQDERLSGGITTCIYPNDAVQWMGRGQPLFNFCKNVCGIDYIQNECLYYEQARAPKPVVYGHHNHIFLGNTLLNQHYFNLVIGDENPLNSAVRIWHIPASRIIPRGVTARHPLWNVLAKLVALAHTERSASGAKLFDALGGAQAVSAALKAYREMPDEKLPNVVFRRPEHAPRDYLYMPLLAELLQKDADALLDYGDEGLMRVRTRDDGTNGFGLSLVARREPCPFLPKHVIWCDATPRQILYEAVLKRPCEIVRVDVPRVGKVYQVAHYLNNMASLLTQEREPRPAYTRIAAYVEHIARENKYERWAVMTFKDGKHLFGTQQRLHFGGNRGTNQWRDGGDAPDAVFVVGAPIPSAYDIEVMATAIFNNRTEPFANTWERRDALFPGTDVPARKSDYWDDPHLSALVWLFREAEIVQSAHRAGLNLRDVPVYLVTNLPIEELPPDEIVKWRDLLNIPEDYTAKRWIEVLKWAEETVAMGELLTIDRLCNEFDVSRETGRKWVERLIAHGWTPVHRVTKRGMGKVEGAAIEWLLPQGVSVQEWYNLLRLDVDVYRAAELTGPLGIRLDTAERYIDALVESGVCDEVRILRGGAYLSREKTLSLRLAKGRGTK